MSLSRLASQQVQRSGGRGVATQGVGQPDGDDRFDLLTKYVPTETITLFVAAMAAFGPLAASFPGLTVWTLYVAGAVLTPLIQLAAIIGKQRAAGVRGMPHPWPLIAALIAYLVWALSVPGVLEDGNHRIVAALGATLVSTALALADPVFGPRPVA